MSVLSAFLFLITRSHKLFLALWLEERFCEM